MTEERLRAMSEEQIRARYAATPSYYLQAKLEKKRALDADRASPASTRRDARAALRPAPTPTRIPNAEPASLDIALPGFEILDAALCEVEVTAPAEWQAAHAEQTQHAKLQAALEDYGNWPLLGEPETDVEPEPAPDRESEHARTLELVLAAESSLDLLLEADPDPELRCESESGLDLVFESEPDTDPSFASEPELDLLLEADPDLELVLESDPWLDPLIEPEPEAAIQSRPDAVPDNVTVGDFRPRSARKVRVVSVIMDRKRPNMVRVVGESTRRAG